MNIKKFVLLMCLALSSAIFAEKTIDLPASDMLNAARKIVLQTGPNYAVKGELSCTQMSREFPPYTVRTSCSVTINEKTEAVENSSKIVSMLKTIKPSSGPVYTYHGYFRAISLSQEFPPFKVTEIAQLVLK